MHWLMARPLVQMFATQADRARTPRIPHAHPCLAIMGTLLGTACVCGGGEEDAVHPVTVVRIEHDTKHS